MKDRDKILEKARAALAVGIRNTLEAFMREHPGEKVYGLKCIISSDNAYLGPTIATEEGLTRVTQKYARLGYAAREGDTRETLRTFLRWANPDDGWYFVRGDPKIHDAEKLLDDAEKSHVIRSASDSMMSLTLETLRALSEAGVFDTGEPGREIVANLTYQDESDEDSLDWAKAANPPSVFARFEAEMKAAQHASAHQVRSPYDQS